MPQPNTARRCQAILDVLVRRSFLPWQSLVQAVEAAVGPGVFGPSPYMCLRADLRRLRAAGVAIGFSRTKGLEGYYLRLESLPEPFAGAIRRVWRDMDWAHLDRIARVPPGRRVQAVFEMIDFVYEVAAAGQRDRERAR